jgi:hypothetical protein
MFLDSLTATFGKALLDVILAIPSPSGSTLALSCEIGGHKAIRQPGMTLVTFAKQHFGHGTLRKVGTHMYAVIRPPQQQPTPISIPTPTPTPTVKEIPMWAYHVV